MCIVVCLKFSFCWGSCRMGTSGLISNTNGLPGFCMQWFPSEKFPSKLCLFSLNKRCKVDSMPDECSGRKLKVAYLRKIDFSFSLLYYALPIESSVKIQSYYIHNIYYIYFYMYIYVRKIYVYMYVSEDLYCQRIG